MGSGKSNDSSNKGNTEQTTQPPQTPTTGKRHSVIVPIPDDHTRLIGAARDSTQSSSSNRLPGLPRDPDVMSEAASHRDPPDLNRRNSLPVDIHTGQLVKPPAHREDADKVRALEASYKQRNELDAKGKWGHHPITQGQPEPSISGTTHRKRLTLKTAGPDGESFHHSNTVQVPDFNDASTCGSEPSESTVAEGIDIDDPLHDPRLANGQSSDALLEETIQALRKRRDHNRLVLRLTAKDGDTGTELRLPALANRQSSNASTRDARSSGGDVSPSESRSLRIPMSIHGELDLTGCDELPATANVTDPRDWDYDDVAKWIKSKWGDSEWGEAVATNFKQLKYSGEQLEKFSRYDHKWLTAMGVAEPEAFSKAVKELMKVPITDRRLGSCEASSLSSPILVGSVALLGLLVAVFARRFTLKRRPAPTTEEPDLDLEAQM